MKWTTGEMVDGERYGALDLHIGKMWVVTGHSYLLVSRGPHLHFSY